MIEADRADHSRAKLDHDLIVPIPIHDRMVSPKFGRVCGIPPPVSFTSLEVLKLILAYTHTCSKIPKRTLEACLFNSSKTYSID